MSLQQLPAMQQQQTPVQDGAAPQQQAPATQPAGRGRSGRGNAARQKKGGGAPAAAAPGAEAGQGPGQSVEAATPEGFSGDLDHFRRRMELAFGLSFSDVKVHDGAEGQRGVSAGAAATTRGTEIFLGERFALLGLTEQEGILAHEFSHVAQQRQAGRNPLAAVGAGGPDAAAVSGDREADANQAALSAVAGQAAAVQALAPGGASQDFSLSETWQSVQSSVVGFALDSITNVADLLAYIGRVGESLARPAIDWLARHRTEVLVAFITGNPLAGLAVYALRQLPSDRVAYVLRTLDSASAAQLVGVAIGAGAVAVVGAALAMMGPVAIPILRLLAVPALTALWSVTPETLRRSVRQILVENWPVGLGLELEAGIGATFGYPIFLGADSFFTLSHFEEGVFKLRRGGTLREAFDTGVGAGGYVGLGGGGQGGGGGGRGRGGGASRGGGGQGGGQGGPQGGGIGLGAEAGAQFQAGLKQTVIEEFQFPVLQDDGAFLPLIFAVLGADGGGAMSLMGLLSPAIRRVNPEGYRTSVKFEFKAYAEGNAGAFGGVRTATPGQDGQPGTQPGGSTWTSQQGARDTGAPNWWQRWMQASVFGRIFGEAGVGIEQRTLAFTQDSSGARIPARMEVDAYGEGSAALGIVHAIPVISAALPQLPSFDGGGGIRVTWSISGTPGNPQPEISAPRWQLYAKTGEMDRYQGAASETSISLTDPSPGTFASFETFLANIQAGSTFKRRFSVGTTLGRAYTMAANRQGAFNVMLPADYRRYGFRIEGYLDLESEFTADQMRTIFRTIVQGAQEYAQGGAVLQRLYQDVLTFLGTGRAPANIARHATTIANTILSGVKTLHFHAMCGLSIAAGAQASAGAKVRLQGRAGAYVTVDRNLLPEVRSQMSVENITQLLRNQLGVGGPLEIPGQGG